MSTITAILDVNADGTLHLPIPAEMRESKVKVTASIETAKGENDRPSQEMALAALRKLRELGTFSKIIDPVRWQREIREDRPAPSEA